MDPFNAYIFAANNLDLSLTLGCADSIQKGIFKEVKQTVQLSVEGLRKNRAVNLIIEEAFTKYTEITSEKYQKKYIKLFLFAFNELGKKSELKLEALIKIFEEKVCTQLPKPVPLTFDPRNFLPHAPPPSQGKTQNNQSLGKPKKPLTRPNQTQQDDHQAEIEAALFNRRKGMMGKSEPKPKPTNMDDPPTPVKRQSSPTDQKAFVHKETPTPNKMKVYRQNLERKKLDI